MIPSFASMFIIFASVHGYLIHISSAFSKQNIYDIVYWNEMSHIVKLSPALWTKQYCWPSAKRVRSVLVLCFMPPTAPWS